MTEGSERNPPQLATELERTRHQEHAEREADLVRQQQADDRIVEALSKQDPDGLQHG